MNPITKTTTQQVNASLFSLQRDINLISGRAKELQLLIDDLKTTEGIVDDNLQQQIDSLNTQIAQINATLPLKVNTSQITQTVENIAGTIPSGAAVTSKLNGALANWGNQNFKKLHTIACVIRNDGSGWKQIGGEHIPINLDGVSVDSNGDVFIDYSGLNANRVITFLATPDEELAGEGWLMGASVRNTSCSISLYRQINVSVRIIYNGTNFEVSSGDAYNPIESVTAADGIISIKLKNSFYDNMYSVGVTPLYEGLTNHFNVYGLREQLLSNEIKIFAHNLSGADTIDSDVRFWLNIAGRFKFNANQVVSEWGNIWCFGILGEQ